MTEPARPPIGGLTAGPGAIAQVAAYVVVLVIVLAAEALRWTDDTQRDVSLSRWLCGEQADWLPFLPWLLLAPVFWNLRRRKAAPHAISPQNPQSASATRPWVMACGAAGLSFLVSLWVAGKFGPLPPAYHDEFSYLFQAKTFLAGRLWFPSFAPLPELFDQMHVLNEGRFASRYFPGAGLWLAPFVWLGNAWLGQWIAGALTAFFVFWIGRDVGGDRVGLLAAVLAALSPGLALFSNLLLAHHPALVGLMVFLLAWFRAWRSNCPGWAFTASCGLTFAMLCRPMTAFGIALPFGLYTAYWLARELWTRISSGPASGPGRPRDGTTDHSTTHHSPITLASAFAVPILAGLACLFHYNRSLTGDGWISPYQLYTDTYTPRHVYGFNNVVRGEQRLGPKVLDHYDRWAENLTPRLAARNVAKRTEASLRWTLGIVPLVLAALALLLSRGPANIRCRLIAAGIVSLHAVHVPYWFEGIMGWHYVFESAPLWLVLFAEATRRLCAAWHQLGRRAMPLWWGGLTCTAVAVNLLMLPSLWPGRLELGVKEVAFSRRAYARFQDEAQRVTAGQRAIVYVEPDPADRHIDYVVNDPPLDGRILYARYRPGTTTDANSRQWFPDRSPYLYRAAQDRWQPLP